MSTDDPIVAAANRLLDLVASRPPAERFEYWVRLGIIDRDGQLTKRYGGAADAERDSIDAAALGLSEPIDRLLWVLRGGNTTLCLDGSTAARLLGEPSITRLIGLIEEAVERGLVERWASVDGRPAALDARVHEHAVIGARLTSDGLRRAGALEDRFDPDLPLESLAR